MNSKGNYLFAISYMQLKQEKQNLQNISLHQSLIKITKTMQIIFKKMFLHLKKEEMQSYQMNIL